ncbi:MAG: 1-aminocyclopropane-1-carboxylate deaminase [Rhodospirillaceae bacterium]|nr:1-aminocyclopropane-1-carboxylate deaminase [Rhodospirillaceae bacterium]|tara:strand:+ start:4626 stop:5783 length:1158 start_codon:yes stop_codon:yes gene_type:complete
MALKVSRRGVIPPFIVMDVLRAANRRQAEGKDVLHLELGQPASGAPAGVIETAHKKLESDQLGYTEAFGIMSVRQRISEYYAAEQSVSVDPEQIVLTTGSSGGFVLAFTAAFDVGDRVAIADPGYPGSRNILLGLGIEPVLVPTGPETRFQPTPELLDKIDGPLDGLIVASPSNPTGTMLGESELGALSEYCRDRGVRLISDEIYHGITYENPGVSALRFDDEAIVINSFSKYFSMTGWRVGWMVVPTALSRSIECLAQNLFISAPTLSQYGAGAAFDCTEELDANVERYAQNREILLKGLPTAGFDQLAPVDGAFYIYADISNLTNDSESFCRRVLDDTGVATTPGTDFDQGRGSSFIRFSFSGATNQITEAVERLQHWMTKTG